MNVYFNKGQLDFDLSQNYTFEGMGEVKGIDSADLDKDGDIDIVLGDHNGDSRGDRVLFNNGSGWMVDSGQSIGRDITWDVLVRDLNYDGAPDYISINRYGFEPTRVHFNNGSGFFATSVDVPDALDDSYDIKCFARDSRTYCFIANSEGVSRRQNRMLVFDSTGKIVVNKGFGRVGAETKGMCLVDMNSDGILDVVAGNYNGDSLVYYLSPGTDGLLNFTGSKSLFVVGQTTAIACADFSADGLTDSVVGFERLDGQKHEYRFVQQESSR